MSRYTGPSWKQSQAVLACHLQVQVKNWHVVHVPGSTRTK